MKKEYEKPELVLLGDINELSGGTSPSDYSG